MALTTNGSRPILDASKSPGINAGRPVFCSASSLAACADAAPLDVLERPDGRGSIALEVASRDSREAGRACAANVEHRALTLLGNGGSSALAPAPPCCRSPTAGQLPMPRFSHVVFNDGSARSSVFASSFLAMRTGTRNVEVPSSPLRTHFVKAVGRPSSGSSLASVCSGGSASLGASPARLGCCALDSR